MNNAFARDAIHLRKDELDLMIFMNGLLATCRTAGALELLL